MRRSSDCTVQVRSGLGGLPTTLQWDPERDLGLNPLPHRAIQIGLSGEAVDRYVDDWTTSIRDVTPLAHEVHAAVIAGDEGAARGLLPAEPYPLTGNLVDRIGRRRVWGAAFAVGSSTGPQRRPCPLPPSASLEPTGDQTWPTSGTVAVDWHSVPPRARAARRSHVDV